VRELSSFLGEPQFSDELAEQARVLLGEPAACQGQDLSAGELGLERRLVGCAGQGAARCRYCLSARAGPPEHGHGV